MTPTELAARIDAAWDGGPADPEAVVRAIDLLDSGVLRVASPRPGRRTGPRTPG